ncbi:MAG: hypothetical protein JWO65_605 [Sphingomonas bacterium]|jgi:hypothetical protein|nr:hypothetical protein [Sphingomonas bacterium]
MKSFLGGIALMVGATALVAPAHAADNIMKVCGAKYQAAKAAKTLPAGQTWGQFLATCRGSAAPAAAPAPIAAKIAPAPVARVAPVAKASHLPGAQSPAMTAMHDRQRKCGQMWSADKAAGKIPAGQTWPKYWSACNTRLKG